MAIKTRIPTTFIIGWQALVLPFEDLTGLDRPELRDYSRYDLEVDLQVAKANGISGAAFRCGMGWSGVDPTFQERWDQAADIGAFWRTGYNVLYPSLSVERQVNHWASLQPDIDVIPRVLDAELQDGQSDAVIGEKIWHAFELIKQADGVYPWLYSRYLLIDKWLKYWTDDMLATLKIWGARYLWDRTREHPGPPYGNMPNLGNRIKPEQWIIHQTADKKPPYPGETGRSTIVDHDRWELGTVEEMWNWISNNYGTPEPPPEPPLPPDIVTQVKKNTDDIAALDDRVTKLEEKQEARVTLDVVAKENFSLAVVVGHDANGKPDLEPPSIDSRIRVSAGDQLTVKLYAAYSEVDDPQTPIIYATGMVEYYIVAHGHLGAGQFCRKDKVIPVS